MDLFVTALAALTFAFWVAATVELSIGRRMLARLAAVDPATLPRPAPRVSVVVAARDEEQHIRAAMRSVLALAYPALEIIAVDDRSTDRTGALLDELAAGDPRLKVIHVATLPAGWLGKNHALHQASQAATGDWVLFTDADVFFAPDTLDRAVAHAEARGLDHLVLGPKPVGGTLGMRTLLAFFALMFALNTRPWRAQQAGRPEHTGIGAFNLVRRRVLTEVGGLSRLPLRPDDDIKLGKLLKDSGYRQEFVEGGRAVTVEWYRSAWDMVKGLEKNSFPFLDYSVLKTLGALVGTFAIVIWPLLALFLTEGWAWWLNLGAVAITGLLMAATAVRTLTISPLFALGYPLGALLMMTTVANSMWRTLAQGGVRWRGTLYPLAELKANRV
jgi:cellulose synthase/poly-beta-1,6-N-acetylglucosamine synthase-like glycosyltransferase